MKNKHVGESFQRAFEGLSHVIWTQKHVRTQLLIFVLALILGYVMRINGAELLFIFSAAALVLVAELFNTAIEVTVNMVTERYHPLAKIAKDVAAAGVLVSTIYAAIVAGVVFLTRAKFGQLVESTSSMKKIGDLNLVVIVLLAVAVVSIIVALAKVRIGHGTILRGGAVSGHSATAFLLAAVIALASQFNPLVTICAFLLAILVAQSRVEGKIHSLAEVIWGAVVAIVFVALLVLLS